MHVTQEGPDVLSRYCPVQAFGPGETANTLCSLESRHGMVESLRVLKACRKTAVAARRVALQMIHNTIVCAPDELRETLRRMIRMHLIRTLAAWRPDLTVWSQALMVHYFLRHGGMHF